MIENLRDALKQVNQYLGLGLVAAISAFVLGHLPPPKRGAKEENTEVMGFVKMPRYAAQLVLLGVYFVAGTMAYLAAESALTILSQLPEPLRSAACTQASILTSAVGYRLAAAALPIVFVLPILWRQWKRLRAISPQDSGGMIALVGFFMIPYLALGLVLLRV